MAVFFVPPPLSDEDALKLGRLVEQHLLRQMTITVPLAPKAHAELSVNASAMVSTDTAEWLMNIHRRPPTESEPV